jgi:hypothetical protein
MSGRSFQNSVQFRGSEPATAKDSLLYTPTLKIAGRSLSAFGDSLVSCKSHCIAVSIMTWLDSEQSTFSFTQGKENIMVPTASIQIFFGTYPEISRSGCQADPTPPACLRIVLVVWWLKSMGRGFPLILAAVPISRNVAFTLSLTTYTSLPYTYAIQIE